MKRTKIICTLGPATDDLELLQELLRSGMDLARFNFSHGDHAGHGQRLALLRQAAAAVGKVVGTIADTKGPELRLGLFAEPVELARGSTFTLTTEDCLGDASRASVNYPDLPGEVQPGSTILLNDGLLTLKVVEVAGKEIVTQVISGGLVSSRKRVACPGLELNLPFLSSQDEADILFAAQNGMDYVAASFVQKAADVLAIRKVLEEAGYSMGIIAKIENQAGVDHIQEIINAADAVMVARGDLGVEIPAEQVPLVQKDIIQRCNAAGKPVITATQMLESMCHANRCTRAEASDVANSIMDGTDVIMLSGETASGDYPLEAVQTMARIATTTEEALDYTAIFQAKGLGECLHSAEAVSHAAAQIAEEIGADAILALTETGYTPRLLAKYKPYCPIVALSRLPGTVGLMTLYWGVYPLLGPYASDTEAMLDLNLQKAVKAQLIKESSTVVITTGVPLGKPGSTNMIRVVNVGRSLLRATGIGRSSVRGRICQAYSGADFSRKLEKGDILVVDSLDEAYVPEASSKAAGIIAVEGGLTSVTAVVAITCGLPVLVGAAEARTVLQDGLLVTLDPVAGAVYEGEREL